MAFNIAIDGTGINVPLDLIIGAVVESASKNVENSFLVVGDSISITRELSKYETIELNVGIEHIEARTHQKPWLAGIEKCFELAKSGEAKSIVGFGNSKNAAKLAADKLGVIDKVDAPAVSKILATHQHKTIFLDVAYSQDASAKRLVQLAKIGSVLSKLRLNVAQPRVALISEGSTEEGYREADRQLPSEKLDYKGICPYSSLLDGSCDVAVIDGAQGQTVFAALETASDFFYSNVKKVAKAKLYAQSGLYLGRHFWAESFELVENSLEDGVFIAGLKVPLTLFFKEISQERLARALISLMALSDMPFTEEFATHF